ncbi:MAG: Segregation and condensation protein A [Calditrichaeota bacterium]|nr:Segregation and condensation protein A [Calditrichota bacterium]
MSFTLDIPVYEGPMDLLLHVVRQHRIDLLEVPLAEIAGDFLAYTRRAPALDLDEAGEVIYTASLLLRMKVRFLLPGEDGTDDTDNGERVGEMDEELEEVYLGIVAAARELAGNEQRQRLHFPRGRAAGQVEIDETEVMLTDISPLHLAEAFRQVERRLERTPARQLALFKVTVEEQAALVLRALRDNRRISFQRVIDSLSERIEVVITFLALLDLLRMRRIRLRQHELFGEIWIQRGPKYSETIVRRDDGAPSAEQPGLFSGQ